MTRFYFQLCFFYLLSYSPKNWDNKSSLFILSLENKKTEIIVSSDFVNNKITFRLGKKDSIVFLEFTGLTRDIQIIGKKFMVVEFSVRGGTGVKFRRHIELCVSNDKIYDVLNLYSLQGSVFKETYNKSIDSLHLYDERTLKQLFFRRIDQENNISEIQIIERMERKSKNKSLNILYPLIDTFSLKFDKAHKVFYNKYQQLTGNFSLIDYQGSSIERRFSGESFFTVKLKFSEYVFINNSWYFKNDRKQLINMSDIHR